ncbi:class I SAM-dependent methyltransferase [Cupriavidus basilensis]|uniref:class I SAM-dependent methyltransferase n=1 Tax=Cupriavidus basilensis TaxID=68895 RepID=UPI0007508299|nr:class I SAM-dependent methyltransferase [Cupriavidus basilensis]
MTADTVQDRINRHAWRSWGARRWFGTASDWTDPGEAAAIAWVADQVRGQPILDVGVGGGRTVPPLRALSSDYTAVDYMPEMVAICRRNHPGVRVEQMDARDMAALPDGHFALVMFSFNGIDAVDHAGREAILREFARVLRPGGLVLFSTHNLRGPSYRENLSKFLRLPRLSANPVAVGVDAARVLCNLPLATFNYLRHSRLNREFDGYAIRVCAAHKFGIVIFYTELEAQRRALARLGLHTEVVFGNVDAAPLRDGQDLGEVYWFHFIARKAAGAVRQPAGNERAVNEQ